MQLRLLLPSLSPSLSLPLSLPLSLSLSPLSLSLSLSTLRFWQQVNNFLLLCLLQSLNKQKQLSIGVL